MLKPQFLAAIVTGYGLDGISVSPAPRQFVAETYTLTTPERQTFFCKVVDKPLWIPKLIGSLPVLDALHSLGFERLNYPIKTLSGALYLLIDGSLIVVFNYIDAPQSYDFDYEAFGRLIGEVHALTPRISVAMPQEPFALKHPALFGETFEQILSESSVDPVRQGLQRVFRQREPEIRRHYAALRRAIDACSQSAIPLVITHGDAGGNVLVKAPADLYIIDWDEVLHAPAERDLWIHEPNPQFMAGYRTVFPGYELHPAARSYCTCSQYFDYMAYYLAEILGDFPEAYRQTQLDALVGYFDGWIKAFMDRIDPA